MKYILIIAISWSLIACNENKNSNRPSKSNPEDLNQILGEGVIDGDNWSLSEFSDFFDEDLTLAKIISTFGDTPLKRLDGDRIELVYEISSDKLYYEGVRISDVTITLENDKLVNVEIVFMHIEKL